MFLALETDMSYKKGNRNETNRSEISETREQQRRWRIKEKREIHVVERKREICQGRKEDKTPSGGVHLRTTIYGRQTRAVEPKQPSPKHSLANVFPAQLHLGLNRLRLKQIKPPSQPPVSCTPRATPCPAFFCFSSAAQKTGSGKQPSFARRHCLMP